MTVTEQVFLVAARGLGLAASGLGLVAVRLARESGDSLTRRRWRRAAQACLFAWGVALLVLIAAGAFWLAQQWGLVGWV